MTPNFKDRLPIWEVAADHIVTKMGDITHAYEVIQPEIFTQSEEGQQLLANAYSKAFQVLAPNTIFHKQDWYWQTHWQGDQKPTDSFLSNASEKYHHGRPWLNHRCYIFITRSPARRSIPAGKVLLQKKLLPQDTLSPQAAQEFAAQVSQFIHILADSGQVQCRRLTTDELAGMPGQAGLIEQYCQQITPGTPPELRDIHFGQHIRIGNNHLLVHSIADAEHLPSQCSSVKDYAPYSTERIPFPIGFASSLGLLLPCNHVYNQYIIVEDQAKVRKKMEQKRRRMQSLSAHSRENALGKEAVDAFLNEAITGGQLMVKAHFNIISWTSDPQGIEPLRDMVGAAIAKTGATAYLETEGGPQLWCAGIPGNAADLPSYEQFDILADQAICFLVNDTNYREGVSSFGIRLGDRLHGRPLHVDLSDLPMSMGQITNRNKFVLGGT